MFIFFCLSNFQIEMPKEVDLGFFNGDFKPWGLEKDYDDFEVESRYFPSKVLSK